MSFDIFQKQESIIYNWFSYHSWFSLDGVNEFGDVTLACDDDKRIQAHELDSARVLGLEPVSGSGPFFLQFSWIQLRSWVGNLFQVLVLWYSV